MKASDEIKKKHKTEVTHFLQHKVKELRFHLQTVIDGCDGSKEEHQTSIAKNRKLTAAEQEAQQEQQTRFGKIVTYGFSAFINTVQGIKDSLKTSLDINLTKGDLSSARHGRFIYEARNACTHDGNPVVNAWADGDFFIGTNIIRVNKEEIISIDRPSEDVKTILLEFTIDFLLNLRERVQQEIQDEEGIPPLFHPNEFSDFINENNIIPKEIKEMLSSNSDEISKALALVKIKPIKQFTDEIDNAIADCQGMLNKPNTQSLACGS